MPASDHLQRVTLLLVAVSTAVIEVALDDRDPGAGLPLLGLSLALAGGLWRYTRTSQRTSWDPVAVASVVALATLPIVWDAAGRAFFHTGFPYEVQLAYFLRNAMFALVAMPRLPRATNQAALASFFLTVFGYLWSHGALAVALLIVYALLGTWWLLAAYWDRLGGRFADSSESNIPLRPAAASLVGLMLVGLLMLPLVDHSSATTALAGFFPSSGGTQWSDPFAHGGVGDGDQMVAAKEQASSFGPVDSELFLESEMPSLYDALNEFSEADPKKIKQSRRAIPLASSQSRENHEKKGMTQQATREFSTVRRTKTPHRHVDDRLSAALLLVKGKTPLHLALETYDHWDGRSLIATDSTPGLTKKLRDKDEFGQRWLDLSINHPKALFNETHRSQVRVVNLKTNRVPMPAGTTAVTLESLHDPNLFKFATDGSLAMDVKFVPQLTIFEFRSALRGRHAQPGLAHSAPNEEQSRVNDLATEWTAGVPPGWLQVEAIVNRLRADYAHDREAMVPPGTSDAVEHFLLESKRGPDYLFAASTAVLLRSLGYDARVRSGFYASPERFSRTARMTPVLAEDAHFWVEVRTENGASFSDSGETLPGVWLTIEPTPGYDVLFAPESLVAWLHRSVTTALADMIARPIASTTALLAFGLVVASRRSLIDGLLIGWWSLRSRTAQAEKLTRLTLRLVEWRAWTHRRRRPAGVTLGNWSALESHDDFVLLASWALYGGGSAAPLSLPSARLACGRAVRARFGRPNEQRTNPPNESTAA